MPPKKMSAELETATYIVNKFEYTGMRYPDRIREIAAALRQYRDEGLEEAAKAVEGFTILDPIGAAVAIRALKTPEGGKP